MKSTTVGPWICGPACIVALVGAIGCSGAKHAPSPTYAADPVRPAVGASPAVAMPDEDIRAQVSELWRARTRNGVPIEFCLGPQDVLEISVFHFPEMTGVRVRISASGTISLPMIGEMQAAGLTEDELRKAIADKLRGYIMKDPNVTVFVSEHASQQVSVTGAVTRPGLFNLSREHRTVSNLISEAGGASEQAGGQVLLYPASVTTCEASRGGVPTPMAPGQAARVPNDVTPIEFDLGEKYDPPNENPLNLPVIGGDSIVINRGRYFVDGWVNRPGAYDISPGVTVLGSISAAGGANFAGDLSNVTVWRETRGGGKKRIDVDLKAVANGEQKDVKLQSGDVVNLPMSPAMAVPYGGYWIIHNMVSVGAAIPLF